MIIDAYSHVLTPKYLEALKKAAPKVFDLEWTPTTAPALWDLDLRFRIMDNYPGLVQVISNCAPVVGEITDAKTATQLARLANDEMADLVAKYPDRFAGAIANLPFNDMEAALEEADRAIKELKFRGVQIYTTLNGCPLDHPKFMPLYEKMCQYNLPIWLHPRRDGEGSMPHYSTEKESKYYLHGMFGWPYETAVAMGRLVFSGTLEKYPDLKLITHHSGSMVSIFEDRITTEWNLYEMLPRAKSPFTTLLRRQPVDYFRTFYADTALKSLPSLMATYSFFGAEHIVFGVDVPFDREFGNWSLRITLDNIAKMDIPDSDKKKILEGNARKLLRLPV